MKVHNAHGAPLNLPNGQSIAPDAEVELDAETLKNEAVKAWIAGGVLVPVNPADVKAASNLTAPATEGSESTSGTSGKKRHE